MSSSDPSSVVRSRDCSADIGFASSAAGSSPEPQPLRSSGATKLQPTIS